jgi:hypothetical protein
MENGSTNMKNVIEGEGKTQAKCIEFNYQPLNRKQLNKRIAYAV